MYSSAILLAIMTERSALVVVTKILMTLVFGVFEKAMLLRTWLKTLDRCFSGDGIVFEVSGKMSKNGKRFVLNDLNNEGSRK